MLTRKALLHGALFLAALARASAELIVEHSLDGGATYKPYGTIAGNIVTVSFTTQLDHVRGQ